MMAAALSCLGQRCTWPDMPKRFLSRLALAHLYQAPKCHQRRWECGLHHQTPAPLCLRTHWRGPLLAQERSHPPATQTDERERFSKLLHFTSSSSPLHVQARRGQKPRAWDKHMLLPCGLALGRLHWPMTDVEVLNRAAGAHAALCVRVRSDVINKQAAQDHKNATGELWLALPREHFQQHHARLSPLLTLCEAKKYLLLHNCREALCVVEAASCMLRYITCFTQAPLGGGLPAGIRSRMRSLSAGTAVKLRIVDNRC